MGANHSLGETLEGGAVMGILALLLTTVLLWMASNSLSPETLVTSNLLIALAIMRVGQAIVEFVYFFQLAACFSALQVCLLSQQYFSLPECNTLWKNKQQLVSISTKICLVSN